MRNPHDAVPDKADQGLDVFIPMVLTVSQAHIARMPRDVATVSAVAGVKRTFDHLPIRMKMLSGRIRPPGEGRSCAMAAA
jgi:hypothetical protein